ncbi:MAG: TIR domain-containing protein [Verrucomicrobiales bacterium]
MSYRNKTYVIFDGDEDMWAYSYMKGWKQNERIDFNFFDAHDLKPITDRADENTVKRSLRARLSNTKQAIVIIGEKTKNLFRFVRWEMETCQKIDIPIVAVNLNGLREQDPDRCPPVIRDEYAVHIPFKLRIIQYALDQFPREYSNRDPSATGPRFYNHSVYQKLGLNE